MARAPRKTGRRPADAPLRGFISYSHDDVAMMRRFRDHLTSVEKAFEIPFWADESIQAGDHWDDSILAEINRANVFLLLVSPSTIASRYINEKEFPAIAARAQAVKGLICPIVLSPCDAEAAIGPLEPAPKQGRRLLPVSAWTDPEQGYDTARQAVHAAIRAHFKREPRNAGPFDALIGYREEQPGPIYVIKDNQFDLDPGGDRTDTDAAATNVARQLHAANRRKAAELLAMMPRLHNNTDAVWKGLAEAVDRLHQALDRPIEEIPDHIAAVWEASVAAASFLLIDKGLRDTQSRDPAPLPIDIHRTFDDLVGSLAPWIRRFPTALGLDEDRGAFLAQPALFATAAAVIQGARDTDLITPATDATLRTGEATTQRDTSQAAKAGTFSIRAARGLLTRSGSYFAGFLAGAVASSYATHSPLTDRVGRFLAQVETHATALIVDLPADIRLALGRLIGDVAKGDVPKPVDPPSAMPPAATDRSDRPATPGTIRHDGPDYPEMVLIPSGDFMMGIPEAETKREESEQYDKSARPEHQVTIRRPFWMGRYPVTRGEFATFIEQSGHSIPDGAWTFEPDAKGERKYQQRPDRGWHNPGFPQTEHDPVTCVSHADATAYVAWLNDRTGGSYRLPSEAEWEYAARAGTKTARYWGDGFEDAGTYAWVRANTTAPVGERRANGFGLYDMLGNVWEWVADPWHEDYQGAPVDGSVWTTRGSAASRVLRGGSWYNSPRSVRAGYRYHIDVGYRNYIIGFRLARTSF